MVLFEDLVEQKIVRILRLLVENKGEYYHLQKIASDAKVPIASTFRLVNKLVKIGYIDFITVGKFKIYKLADNEKIKQLERMVR